jgi:hypothetical protein
VDKFGVSPEPMISTRIAVTVADGGSRFELRLSDPENTSSKPKAGAFDLDGLLKRYRVTDVRSVDDPPPG